MFNEFRREVIVGFDIGGIVDNHLFKLSFNNKYDKCQ